jgi:hypothetical protein
MTRDIDREIDAAIDRAAVTVSRHVPVMGALRKYYRKTLRTFYDTHGYLPEVTLTFEPTPRH